MCENKHNVMCKNKHVACRQVVVGNSRGRVALLDLRRKGMVHVFKGMAGSVRSVVCHPTLPLVASCGLDRFFRLHDLQTHMLLSKVHLTSLKAHARLELFTVAAQVGNIRHERLQSPFSYRLWIVSKTTSTVHGVCL